MKEVYVDLINSKMQQCNDLDLLELIFLLLAKAGATNE